MESERQVPIWWFIGLLLVVYGVLILGGSVYGYYHPSPQLARLPYPHAGIWWGLLLIVIGAVFTIRSWPRKR